MYDVNLPVGARLLYMLLDDCARVEGVTPVLKQQRLAALLGASIRTLGDWLAELAAAGHIHPKRVSKGVYYALAWRGPVEKSESDPQILPITAPVIGNFRHSDRQTVADHFLNNFSVLSTVNVVVPDAAVEISAREAVTLERVRRMIREFPGAHRLAGMPDDDICRQCLGAVDGDEDRLFELLKLFHREGSAPSRSWGWFPAVIVRRLQACREKGA